MGKQEYIEDILGEIEDKFDGLDIEDYDYGDIHGSIGNPKSEYVYMKRADWEKIILRLCLSEPSRPPLIDYDL